MARRNSSGKSVETFIRSMRTLSKAGEESMNEVNCGKDPNKDLTPVHLSRYDIWTLFWNSRLNVCIANLMRVSEPDNPAWELILRKMQAGHGEVCRLARQMILLSAIKPIVGRLGLGMYAHVLLWTYGEELELLSQISERCSPLEGTAIRAIL
jgi:hypothetical protein